ncbi:sugar nucleotide-binding protein [Nonomuraea sp. B5E05]|uniref:sugar nucleotide-binding protein n=1 Tax=Nonomuraea sp. B5E05 TaxID=3153569 RepID=UPI003260A2F1
MRFLIVGGSGLLGGELARQCSTAGHEVAATYLSRPGETEGVAWSPLDVRRREDVGTLISARRPEVVINAAYRQTDWATTATGAAHVALAAATAADLAAALLELAVSGHHGTHHVAGADAVSRYELGRLIARRDGLDADRLPSARRADAGVPGPVDVRLECGMTQRRLRTRLRGAREFLR